MVSDCKVEASEEQRPPGLSGIESFNIMKIFQIVVIRYDLKWVVSSLQPVSPL